MNYYFYEYEWEVEYNDDLFIICFDLEFKYFPETPHTFYLANGDPGIPGAPEEVQIINVVCTRILSENCDREPTDEEAYYWEKRFKKEMMDDDYLIESLLEAGHDWFYSEDLT